MNNTFKWNTEIIKKYTTPDETQQVLTHSKKGKISQTYILSIVWYDNDSAYMLQR